MITQLYTFSVGSYVVADEWNANFRVLENTNLAHYEAIVDAGNLVAFPSSDLSAVFESVSRWFNSNAIGGDRVKPVVENEYFKTLYSGEDLTIDLEQGLCANVRIIVSLQDDRALETPPFIINYSGTKIENIGDLTGYSAGMYFIFIYETNGVAQIKIAKAGV